MSADDVRATLQRYVEALVGRGDFGRFFADDVVFEVKGQPPVRGAAAAEAAIRSLHEAAFDAEPELVGMVADEHGAAVEVLFVGTHTGEFAGVPATGRTVRVPYSVFYEVADGRIQALRIYGFAEELVRQVTAPAAAEPAPSRG